AFADDHRASRFWEAYPSALFLLPRFELDGRSGGGGNLRVRAVLDDGDDPEVARAELEDEVRAMATRLATAGSRGPDAPVGASRRETDRGLWEDAVREALAEIRSGRFSKVVLARTLDVTSDRRMDPADVVAALWEENRGTHVFLFEPVPGRPLVGAAPETIATLRGERFQSTAVAGSTRRGETAEEADRLAGELLASVKDRAEQRMVVEDVVERLAPLADEVRVQDRPHVLRLARIQHLETEIRAHVPPGSHVLELVAALHPTPAVCGLPRDRALRFLREEEPFQRGWYAGPVGWFDDAGDGVFAPALRTAVAHGRSWRLFAGAGIVEGSRPEAEWEETRIKFEPVLRALDAVAAGVAGPGGPAEPA
ncbi:MAG TPA: isochorismate synthase, partial [Longimicrobiales bacterium]|nr:isochorismate synthase [Longimicrobiales bacterium]